jgi:Cu(I)/Ag(I) efflux system membrane fusion protein
MKLIPVSQLESEQTQVTQRAGLETEKVGYRALFKEIRAPGKLDYNERRVKVIAARVEGRVDRVHADFVGIKVNENYHLVDIYSPGLVSAQTELLLYLDAYERAPGDKQAALRNLEAARAKLQLLGILPEQIAEVERNRRETTHLTIYAPLAGVIVEKSVREGQYVKEGDMLYRIAELDPIWLYLDIYEYDHAWIRPGQPVDVSVEAYAGESFPGMVVFIDPFLNDATRTVKVRVNLKNPDLKLKAAMYASAKIHVRLSSDGRPAPTGLEGKFICPMHPEVVSDQPGTCSICKMPLEQVPDLFPLGRAAPPRGSDAASATGTTAEPAKVLAVRKSAVLDTGRRQVAYRKRKDGAYELVELKLGPLAEARDSSESAVSYYPVLAGLSAGDEVVIQGGFLLDSQMQIEGMPSLLYAEGRSAAALHAGHGGMSMPSSAPPTSAPAAPGGHKH